MDLLDHVLRVNREFVREVCSSPTTGAIEQQGDFLLVPGVESVDLLCVEQHRSDDFAERARFCLGHKRTKCWSADTVHVCVLLPAVHCAFTCTTGTHAALLPGTVVHEQFVFFGVVVRRLVVIVRTNQ